MKTPRAISARTGRLAFCAMFLAAGLGGPVSSQEAGAQAGGDVDDGARTNPHID